MYQISSMVGVTKLYKNDSKSYRLLGAEDNGEVIWAITTNDKAVEAGNRVSKQEFNDKLQKEGWEAEINTSFTFFDGKFEMLEHNDDTL